VVCDADDDFFRNAMSRPQLKMSCAEAWVNGIAQAVAEKVVSEDNQRDYRAREDSQ
jgi:hypothetical protein